MARSQIIELQFSVKDAQLGDIFGLPILDVPTIDLFDSSVPINFDINTDLVRCSVPTFDGLD